MQPVDPERYEHGRNLLIWYILISIIGLALIGLIVWAFGYAVFTLALIPIVIAVIAFFFLWARGGEHRDEGYRR